MKRYSFGHQRERMNMRAILLTALFALSVVTLAAAAETESSNMVKEVKFDAEFYVPQGKSKNLAILVLGGSEGGIPRRHAQMLAKEGFPTLTLGYFKTKQTPEYLDMIPLEYFDEPIKWFESHPQARGKKIVAIGSSKGGELALLLASRKPQIRGVVAFVPSSVVFQGIPKVFWPPRSSWTYKGKPLLFVPYDYGQGIDPQNLLKLYQQSLKQQEAVKQAEIQVEKINGPMLLFSGTGDTMWPSAEMCEMISHRLKEKNFKHKYEHIKYDKAGHTLDEYFMMGGTKEGNRKAGIDSTRRMLEFLNELSAE